MGASNTRIFLKMKNKGQLIIERYYELRNNKDASKMKTDLCFIVFKTNLKQKLF